MHETSYIDENTEVKERGITVVPTIRRTNPTSSLKKKMKINLEREM